MACKPWLPSTTPSHRFVCQSLEEGSRIHKNGGHPLLRNTEEHTKAILVECLGSAQQQLVYGSEGGVANSAVQLSGVARPEQ